MDSSKEVTGTDAAPDAAHLAEQLRQAQQQIVQLETRNVEARVVTAFAHLIRNALTSVTFYFEALRQVADEPADTRTPDIREALEGVQRGVDRALRVTTRISEYAQASAASISPDAQAAVARNLQSVAYRFAQELRAMNMTLQVDVPADLTVPMSDAHLQTIATHLISNARDALKDVAEPTDGKRISLRGAIEADATILTCTDNGAGFTEEAKTRMFEPFFSTKGPLGTGLGLALCRKLLTLYRGEISVDRLELGTCVRLRLLRKADRL